MPAGKSHGQPRNSYRLTHSVFLSHIYPRLPCIRASYPLCSTILHAEPALRPARWEHVAHPNSSPLFNTKHPPGSSPLTGHKAGGFDSHNDVGLQQEVRQGLQQGLQQPQHADVPELQQHLPGTAAAARLRLQL